MSEVWKKLENFLCRCCHTNAKSETSFKSLYTQFIWLGNEKVVFSEMLQECFNIELAPVKDPLSHLVCRICNACMKKLQAAVVFKRQVQNCEKQFQELYMKFIGKVNYIEVDIKQESIEPEDEFVTTIDGQPLSDYANENLILDHSNGAVKQDHDSTSPDNERQADDGSDSGDYYSYQMDTEENTSQVREEKKNEIIKVNLPRKKKANPRKDPELKVENRKPGKQKKDKLVKDQKKSETAVPKVAKPKSVYRDIDYKLVGEIWQCCSCDKATSSVCSMRSHVRAVHLKIPKYSCPQCPKKFFTTAPFVKHKLDEHRLDDRVHCNACEQKFNTKIQLRKHINGFHMLGEKHKCAECDFECFSFEALYKHKYRHKTVKDHHCNYCKKSFVRKTNLQLHERIHTGDRRKVCSICGQAFVQKASLNYHMTKYHPEVSF